MSDKPVSIARVEQSQGDKKRLIDMLRDKKPRELEQTILLGGEPVTLKFRAISAVEMDRLREKHPPTTEQKARNLGVNVNTYPPALVAATLIEPELSYEEAKEIWESEAWSAGELDNLFTLASALCTAGFDIPSTASD